MFRIALLGALLLAGCPDKNPNVPDAPRAPLGPHTFRAPTLKCTLEVPSGWTTSGSAMPDHILELIATAPGLRGRMVIRQALEATVALAADEGKQRTVASWGTQPDFTLLREDPVGEGRLLAYQWRPQASAPVERHLIAIMPIESKVVLAYLDDDGATPEKNLLGSLATLKCSPK